MKLDVDRIQHGKDPNITLAAGDILWVPETTLTKVEDWVNRNIYVRGGVNAIVTYDVTGLDFMNNNAKNASLGFSGTNVQNTVDPLGFLARQQSLGSIQTQLPTP